jgi:DNA-binding CsgD family transcriptional regulator
MVIIAIPDFVVRKGLEYLIREYCMQNKIHSAGTIKELNELIKHHEISLIYAHSSFINEIQSVSINRDECKLIRVIYNKPEALNGEVFQTDILYIDDEEQNIIKNIKRNLALAEKTNDSSKEESELSEREKDILREIALGKTNKEIADNLFISAHTAITHRKNITRKLGIKTVSGLTVYAILNKLIQMEEM